MTDLETKVSSYAVIVSTIAAYCEVLRVLWKHSSSFTRSARADSSVLLIMSLRSESSFAYSFDISLGNNKFKNKCVTVYTFKIK